MQSGNIVQVGTGCPATTDGQHHVEDWCRVCGGPAGVEQLRQQRNDLLQVARDTLRIIQEDCSHELELQADVLAAVIESIKGDK